MITGKIDAKVTSELVLDRTTLEWTIVMLENKWRGLDPPAVVLKLKGTLDHVRPNPQPLDLSFELDLSPYDSIVSGPLDLEL